MACLLMLAMATPAAAQEKDDLPYDPIPKELPLPEPEIIDPLDVLKAHPPVPEEKADPPSDFPPAPPAQVTGEKTLHLHSLHTGETVEVVFWRDGEYVQEGLDELDRMLRDHRSGDVIDMDPELFSLIHRLYKDVGARGAIDIISGYRSPKTNAMLKRIGRNVATKSQHMVGKAMDIRFKNVSIEKMRETALRYEAGGVGYYPQSNFVHIDTGRPRQW